MNIKKCNKCKKILTKDDDYYEIDEITFNKGDNPKDTTRLYFTNKNKEEAYDMKQSWCHYTDIDYCPECFKDLGLDKILLEEAK